MERVLHHSNLYTNSDFNSNTKQHFSLNHIPVLDQNSRQNTEILSYVKENEKQQSNNKKLNKKNVDKEENMTSN